MAATIHGNTLPWHLARLGAFINGFFLLTVTAQMRPGSELQAMINSAVSSGSGLIQIPAAEYEFGNAPLIISGARDLVIRGLLDADRIPVTTLWFALGGGVAMQNCVNMTFESVAIDYNGTYAQGVVPTAGQLSSRGVSVSESVAESWFLAAFDDELLLPSNAFFQPPFNASIKIAFWDPESRKMIRNASVPDAINLFAASFEHVNDNIYNVTTTQPIRARIPYVLPEGAMVTMFPRGYRHSLALVDVSNSILRNVHIYGGSSMGIVDLQSDGANVYDGINMTRRPITTSSGHVIDRLLATNADGFHSTNNKVGPTIINSQFSFTGDDLGNICSGMMLTLGTNVYPNGTKTVYILDNMQMMDAVAVPNKLLFYHINTLQLQAVTDFSSAVKTVNTTIVARAEAAKETMQRPPYNIFFVRSILNPPFSIYEVPVVTSFGDFDDIQEYNSFAHLASGVNAGSFVAQNHFHDGYSRVFLLKGSNTTFSGNLIERAGGIHVGPEQIWLEGDPGETNITISNNVFDSIGDPPISIQQCLITANATINIYNNTIKALNN